MQRSWGCVREHRRLGSGRSCCDGHVVVLTEADRGEGGAEEEIEKERVRERERESEFAGLFFTLVWARMTEGLGGEMRQ